MSKPTPEEIAELRRKLKNRWGWGTRKYVIEDAEVVEGLLDAYEAQRRFANRVLVSHQPAPGCSCHCTLCRDAGGLLDD